MKSKKWICISTCIFGFMFIIVVSSTIIIDPFWHYHGPLKSLEYPLNNPRYVNDGIARYSEYEVLITGTSMSDNFRPSQIKEMYGLSAIKTTYSGATYRELSENIGRAISYNPQLHTIICSLDPNKLCEPADSYSYEKYPTYLYDDNFFNDVFYLLNKEVIIETVAVLNYTKAGKKTPTFDEYQRFDKYCTFGKDAVLNSYERLEKTDLGKVFSEEDRQIVYENIMTNYVKLAKENPEITFHFFIPPYSVCFWDGLVRTNQLSFHMEAMKYGVELMLTADNIRVYGFDDLTDVTCDLNRYMDTLHYDADVNILILQNIYEGKNEITEENLDVYFEQVKEFYRQYEMDF